MEPEEMAKNVDACYKNILEKFNPGARQLINAGKSYLKALHGAAAAAKIYLESLSRIAKQAQQGTCGGTSDIGIAMQQMIDVQREIQTQQLNTLKAFYVDLIVPLESNIEKDTKVVQADHKKFNQQFRTQHEIYSKAMTLVKKHSKKSSSKTRTSASYDKEIKHLQTMEEEKAKLDAFCELSLKEAIAQERKRYGFVLERQTSLSKHFLAHYGKGAALLEKHLDGWQETSKAREDLPPCVEFLLGQRDSSTNENLYALPRTPIMTLEDDSENLCSASQMRKSHSIDTSYLYEEAQSTFNEAVNPKITSSNNQNNSAGDNSLSSRINTNLCKSKSEYNLAFASPARSVRSGFGTTARPKSTAVNGESRRTVRALYAYLSSGEHQINFLEGDLILLLGDEPVSFHSNANGDRNKGWYYGENIRTGKRGWFPLAYTEPVKDTDVDSGLGLRSQFDSGGVMASATGTNNADTESTTSGNSSASNCSSAGIAPVMQHLPASSVIALNKAAANMRNKPDVHQQHPMQASNPVSRPTSLLGDRALFSRVPGFGKLRKSRSAFAERILCPATTPSAPGAPQLPGGELVVGPPAGAAPAAPPAVTTPQQVQSPTSAAAPTHHQHHHRLLSPTSSPASSVFSPTKKAPAPPPRLTNQAPPMVQQQQQQSNTSIGIMSDQSLRSSSDSGFANDQQHERQLPPPAPEVDYSDEESIKLSPRLSDWLLYSSAADLTHEAYNSDGEWNVSRPGNGNGQSMTLDRPPKNDDQNGARSGKLASYPPVLGYLATLTRSKASTEQKKRRHQHESTGTIKRDPAEAVNETAAADQQSADRSGVRRLSGLFTKNVNAVGQRDKIKSKLTSAPAILKTALFRSRSKDSVLMVGEPAESLSPAQHGEAPWQHKSSVPCYVGWRPPMPLPKDAVDADAREPPARSRPETFGRISRRSVIRTESRRSNLGWRKYSSESDLLEASESGYMAIDRCPPMTPALSFFNPLVRGAGHGSIGTLRTDFFDEHDEVVHTLPRQRLVAQQEQRVHFKLNNKKQVSIAKRPPAPLPLEAGEERQVPDSCTTFADYSVRLMRIQHHENGPAAPPDAEAERFGLWYDLWQPDPSVRLCEIAQL